MKIFERALAASTLALVIGLGAPMLSASPAAAHDVATRCDWSGCSHIVCNRTGDRCHRFYGDDNRGYRERNYEYGSYDGGDYGDRRYYDRDRGWRYDCDSEADSCYVRRDGYDDNSYDGWDD